MSAVRARVLVVDDEPEARLQLEGILQRAGHDVTVAATGAEALRAFYAERPDLVLLDVTMAGLDGWDVLTRIRDLSDVPVIMLTAHDLEVEKVRGLQLGADDYVTKPFGAQELMARVAARLRARPGTRRGAERIVHGSLVVDVAERRVTLAGEDVQLTPLEFRLLAAFVTHPNQLLAHEQLLELVWADPYGVARDQVRLYVRYLRQKLGWPPSGGPIESVRGFGYRYRPLS